MDVIDNLQKLRAVFNRYRRGQTMTEYALILAAVAVVVYAGYQTMGADIMTLLNAVDGAL